MRRTFHLLCLQKIFLFKKISLFSHILLGGNQFVQAIYLLIIYMKGIKSPHFTELLQIFTFLKACSRISKLKPPELLGRMKFEELLLSLEEEKFDTLLIKTVLIFLLDMLTQFRKKKEFSAQSILCSLIHSKSYSKIDLFSDFYLQIALNEYFILIESVPPKQYYDVYFFSSLPISEKITILLTLINSLTITTIILCSDFLQDQLQEEETKNEEKNNDNITKQKNTKNQKIQSLEKIKTNQNILLGEDYQSLYLFNPFIPGYILKYSFGQWKSYNKLETLTLIRQLLDQQQSNNMLFLIKNISYIYQSYQIEEKVQFFEGLKKVQDKKQEKFQNIKNQLKQFEESYSKALQYNKLYYSALFQRQCLKNQLKEVKNSSDLQAWVKKFCKLARAIYSCSLEEEELPEDPELQKQYYFKKNSNFGPFSQKIKLINGRSVSYNRLLQELFSEECIDILPKVKFLFKLLLKEQSHFIKKCEINQAKRKQQQLLKQRKLEEKKRQIKSKRAIQKRFTRKKRGVTMIDSDEQESDQFSFSQYAFQP